MLYIGSIMMDTNYVLISQKFPRDPSGLLLFKNPFITEANVLFGMNVYAADVNNVVVVPAGAGEQRLDSYNTPLLADNIKTHQIALDGAVLLLLPYRIFLDNYWKAEMNIRQTKMPEVMRPALYLPVQRSRSASLLMNMNAYGFSITLR